MGDSLVINGVAVTKLDETVKIIQNQPAMAKFVFRVTNKWINGAHNQTCVEAFYGAGHLHQHVETFVYEEDEPILLLGHDKGPNPAEYLLVALAGCLTTSLIYHAAARGYSIDSVESEVEGNLDIHGFLGIDNTTKNGFQDITVKFKIVSDLSEEILEDLVETAKQRSPVFDMIKNPLTILVECESL